MRKLIFLALILCSACAVAEDLPTLSCTCDPKQGTHLCPGLLIRFSGDKQASIARLSPEPKWSNWRSLDADPKTLTIDGYGLEPEVGCLTIDRHTGHYRAEWWEVFPHGADGWVEEGVCRPEVLK